MLVRRLLEYCGVCLVTQTRCQVKTCVICTGRLSLSLSACKCVCERVLVCERYAGCMCARVCVCVRTPARTCVCVCQRVRARFHAVGYRSIFFLLENEEVK